MSSSEGLPIARPSKIICAGLNYRRHAEEQGLPLPERPLLFAKWPNALIWPGPADRPTAALRTGGLRRGALGVVIGTACAARPPERTRETVAGFVCLNDVTARDLQFPDGQSARAKSFDTFASPALASLPPEAGALPRHQVCVPPVQ